MECRDITFLVVLFLSTCAHDNAYPNTGVVENDEQSLPPASNPLAENSDFEDFIERTKKRLSKEQSLEQGYGDLVTEEQKQEAFRANLLHEIETSTEGLKKESSSGEYYYSLILKVNDALNMGLINRIEGTWKMEENGMQTELYWILSENRPLQLPSTRQLQQARNFIDIKRRLDHLQEEDPMGEIELNNAKLNIDSEPGEDFYKLVLKVNEAVHNKHIIRIHDTFTRSSSGLSTEIYELKVGKIGGRIRLPSISEKHNALMYFKNKMIIEKSNKLKKSNNQRKEDANPGFVNINSYDQYHIKNTIQDLELEMLEVDSASNPYELYYALVIKVDKAVKNNFLSCVRDTISEGDLPTQLYKVTNERREVRLPSIKELRVALDFVNIKKHLEKEIDETKKDISNKDILQSQTTNKQEQQNSPDGNEEILNRILSRKQNTFKTYEQQDLLTGNQNTSPPVKEEVIMTDPASPSVVGVITTIPDTTTIPTLTSIPDINTKPTISALPDIPTITTIPDKTTIPTITAIPNINTTPTITTLPHETHLVIKQQKIVPSTIKHKSIRPKKSNFFCRWFRCHEKRRKYKSAISGKL